jgi:cysteine desulfurase
MNVTSKSRYALKIMMDLAEQDQAALIHRSDIAQRQGIPLDYMDQILLRLREGGLIDSTRGRSGGYRLAKPATQVSVLEIFSAAEDAFQPVQCLEGGLGCVAEHVCSSKDAWGVISGAIRGSLSGIILTDLVAHKSTGRPKQDPALPQTTIPQECRAPKRRVGGSKQLQ